MKNYKKLQYYLEIGEYMSIMSIMKLVHQTLYLRLMTDSAPH